VLSGEAAHTKFIIFGLTQPGLEPTIYRTRGDHTNYYTTNVVCVQYFQSSYYPRDWWSSNCTL